MADHAFELNNISYAYPEGPEVLREVSLIVRQGDLILLNGESGSGKSTLLKLLNRSLELSPGSIIYKGHDLQSYSIEQLRSTVIYLPQTPVIINGTIEDNIRFPFSFHINKTKKYLQEEARKWLSLLKISFPLNHDAHKLSAGQAQRLALIRTLMLQPEVLLLDEPGSALDQKNRKLIEQTIMDLRVSRGITVLMASHSSTMTNSSNIKICRINNGRLHEAG
ncbi:MAG: ATP-binding cassette domain-containing protein [Nitrospira sp.]|nr:ATP-binding cassette domain-containing protein [bacterium]MBL7049617.1 ATP-binding cassette domain-containing protein [Nitrospira sp.]